MVFVAVDTHNSSSKRMSLKGRRLTPTLDPEKDFTVIRTPTLTGDEIKRLYGALRSELNKLSVQDIRNTVAAAGVDVTKIPSKSEARSGLGSRAEVMPAIDELFGELCKDAQETALCIIAERLIGENPQLAESVQTILGKHGYQFIDGSFVPTGILDERESKFLPASSVAEIAKATSRLIDGDYSGAVTSACGAVDIVMQQIYKEHTLGEPGRASFQAKVNTAAKELGVFEAMDREFREAGMSEKDVLELVKEMKSATNHTAQALQVLRRAMGDTHGSKPAFRHTAYDTIKWASAICSLFDSTNQ